IAAHYDLGNDMFELFLDPTMMYSSGIFPSASASMEEASLYKLDRICQKLRLHADDHLLEIGTGWGSMAIHAAKYYGCRVTTTTISEEQYAWAERRVKEEGLQDKITLLKQDYRLLEGQYDKLVSIDRIEAVRDQLLAPCRATLSCVLKDGGIAVWHATTLYGGWYGEAE